MRASLFAPRPITNPWYLGMTTGSASALLSDMELGARTPEELDSLLEDAFITGDRLALAELLEPGALVEIEATAVLESAGTG